MKEKEEVLRRAVCLLTFADRCSLEEKIFDGVRRSLEERETQRKTIIKWLEIKKYYEYLSEKEKRIFGTPITVKINKEALCLQNDYECIEPMLWSLGLVKELSSYDEFVLNDFHPVLKIGKNHSLESLVESCKNVPIAIVKNYRELSMLWYWRCLECRNNSSNAINILEAIRDIFGEEYIKLLQTYNYFDGNKCDFVIKGKIVAKLSDLEIEKLSIISERRFYAFEWLLADDEWDNVDLVC